MPDYEPKHLRQEIAHRTVLRLTIPGSKRIIPKPRTGSIQFAVVAFPPFVDLATKDVPILHDQS